MFHHDNAVPYIDLRRNLILPVLTNRSLPSFGPAAPCAMAKLLERVPITIAFGKFETSSAFLVGPCYNAIYRFAFLAFRFVHGSFPPEYCGGARKSLALRARLSWR